MTYIKIWPFGKRECKGSFDDFFNPEKYNSLKEAHDAHDFVIVDFVKDENETLYFEFNNPKRPEEKKYHCLHFQHFPSGDFGIALEISKTMY